MSFEFSDECIEEYRTQGYTVFRDILPPSLIGDLRRVTDDARKIAREKRGPQTQRLQPVGSFDIDQQPFVDYAELSVLNDAISRLLTPRHYHGNRNMLGVLLEPAELPYCTAWHRDWRDNAAGLDLSDWESLFLDINLFNQVNCSLYEDSCTWVVPGSHLRRDLPREVRRFPDRPIQAPDFEGKPIEEREKTGLAYCRSMPGAIRLYMDAGDFALYRNTLWHLGNYVPYQKRATLHDAVDTPEFVAWRENTLRNAQEQRASGISMENPNQPVDKS